MKYRTLGNTGLEVSEIGLGATQLCDLAISLTEAEAVLKGALDSGINCVSDHSPGPHELNYNILWQEPDRDQFIGLSSRSCSVWEGASLPSAQWPTPSISEISTISERKLTK